MAMPLSLPPPTWGEAAFYFMNAIFLIFATLLIVEIGYYLSLLIKREKRDQKEHEEHKRQLLSENLPPSLWE